MQTTDSSQSILVSADCHSSINGFPLCSNQGTFICRVRYEYVLTELKLVCEVYLAHIHSINQVTPVMQILS